MTASRGPGLGNIVPEQSDHNQIVKGGGHGCYRNLVLAPASVQEMADLTRWAFELADTYRNPVVVLTDGYMGQMMEPVDFSAAPVAAPRKSWAVEGARSGGAPRSSSTAAAAATPRRRKKFTVSCASPPAGCGRRRRAWKRWPVA